MGQLKTLSVAFLLSAMTLSAVEGRFPKTLCHVDPTCRSMTDDEKDIAKFMFGKKLDTDTIRIYERPRFFKSMVRLLWGDITLAETKPKSNVIFFTPFLSHKGGNKGIDIEVFMHELTHIAQYQFNIPHDERREEYEYEIVPGKPFRDYGPEQQAEIVRDFSVQHYAYKTAVDKENTEEARDVFCRILEKNGRFFLPYFRPHDDKCLSPHL